MSVTIVNQSQVAQQLKAEANQPQKMTTLDRGVDWAKNNTQKGTFVGDHYILAGGSAIIGTTAAVAGVAKLAEKYAAVDRAVEFVFKDNGKLLLGAAAAGTSYVLAEDAVASFKEGSSIKGGAEVLGATLAGMGGTELIGRQFDIPVMKDAISGPARWIGNNAMAVSGGAAAAGSLVLAGKGVHDISEGKTLQGAAEISGGVIGTLGGAELIGRHYNIPIMKEALSGPFKAIFGNHGISKVVGGGITGLAGVAGIADGGRRLTQNKGLLNDAIGTVEITAGVTGITGGISLVGMGIKNEKLAGVFKDNLEIVAGVGLAAGATALAKHSFNNIKENGLGLINTTTATGATLMGLGATQTIASKLGVSGLNHAFAKGWQPVLGVGLGVASYKLGANAIKEGKAFMDDPTAGKAINAGGQALLATLAGAGSAAMVGDALNIPVLEDVGDRVLEAVGKNVLEPVFKAATKHPFLTLGAVVVATGAGYYIYSKTQESEATAKTAAE